MGELELLINHLQFYLTENQCNDSNIIRKHTKKLENLGDVSFPININNWYQLLDKNKIREDVTTIFNYRKNNITLECGCAELKEASSEWLIKIDKIVILPPNVHIFLEKSPVIFLNVLNEVLNIKKYGVTKCLNKKYTVKSDIQTNILNSDLTALRLKLLTHTTKKLIQTFSQSNNQEPEFVVEITLNQKSSINHNVLCGPVLSENKVKTTITADQLYK